MTNTDTKPVVIINSQERQPLYLQITEQIISGISTGTIKTKSRLPSVRQLAADLQINLNTVAAAYRELEKMGIVRISHGLGVQVISQFSTENHSPEEMEKELISLVSRWKLYGYSLSAIQQNLNTIINSWEKNEE